MSVRSYNGKTGVVWHVVLSATDAGGRRVQRVIRRDPETDLPMTKARAKQVERELLVARHRGGVLLPSAITLAAYLERWLAETETRRAESTQYNWRGIVRCRIAPHPIGATILDRLTPYQVEAFLREQGETYAPTTVQTTRIVLSAALNQAVVWQLLPRNPLQGVRVALPPGPARAAWTAAEVQRFLLATAADPDHTLWRLLLDSMMRIGEALALRWADLDWTAGEVTVRRTIAVRKDGSRAPVERTKTTSGQRRIALMPETLVALRRHRAAQNAARLQLAGVWVATDLIFCAGDGRMTHASTIGERFRAAVVTAGVPAGPLHGLRHTGATLAVAAGVPLHAVMQRLGHATIDITANRYAHASREADQALVKVLERVMGSS